MKEKTKMKYNGMKKKKLILCFLAILIISIIICFFMKNNYKNKNVGNNMSNKNLKEIEEYILNISSYQAKMEITIESNKNTNKYLLEQIYQKDKQSKQTILEPSNIEGLEITYEAGKLTINNAKLNLTTVYENYPNLVENCLWIDSFIEDYKQEKSSDSTNIVEENGIVTMETKTRNENNRYIYYKQLLIDKKTGKPTKLLVQDINKKNLIYILYNEITVNGVK